MCVKYLGLYFILVEISFPESSKCCAPLNVLNLLSAITEPSELHVAPILERNTNRERIHPVVTELHLYMARDSGVDDTGKVLVFLPEDSQALSFQYQMI